MASRIDDKKQPRCSFCNKTQDQVRKLIAGPNAFICDECVDICMEIIEDEMEEDQNDADINLLKPVEIKNFLDQYVIGQEQAKKVLSVAVYIITRESHPMPAMMWNCRRAILLW